MLLTKRKKLVKVKSKPIEKAKVLLIEDNRTTRALVRAEIADHCNLIEADSASHGVSMFHQHKPDLAFIDISLPDGSGYNILEWMLQVNPNMFSVMFSGHSDTNNVCKSIDAGAKGFVTKPFDVGKMLFFVNQCRG